MENIPEIAQRAKELRIIGSSVGTRQDVSEVLEMAAAEKLHSKTHKMPLNQVNEIFSQLRKAQIPGRVVMSPLNISKEKGAEYE